MGPQIKLAQPGARSVPALARGRLVRGARQLPTWGGGGWGDKRSHDGTTPHPPRTRSLIPP
eukprot:3833670-Prymnesium_polylepis.1